MRTLVLACAMARYVRHVGHAVWPKRPGVSFKPGVLAQITVADPRDTSDIRDNDVYRWIGRAVCLLQKPLLVQQCIRTLAWHGSARHLLLYPAPTAPPGLGYTP
jgi:hypothetical protein